MDRPDPHSLETHVGYWLRFVSNHVSHAFKLRVEATGVTVAEWVVLRSLFDSSGMKPSQLAEQIALTRGAVSKLVDRLIAKDMIHRTFDKADRRFQAVKLTAKGRRIVPTLAALADENDEAFFGHLDKTQRAALIATLQDIVSRRELRNVPVD